MSRRFAWGVFAMLKTSVSGARLMMIGGGLFVPRLLTASVFSGRAGLGGLRADHALGD